MTPWSRIGAMPIAIFQAAGIATALQSGGATGGIQAVYSPGLCFIMTAVVALTAGTMFLMWVGEQVTERGVGNGVSLIIFAGIVAGLPGEVITTLESFSNGDMSAISLILIVLVVFAFTFFVVFVESGQQIGRASCRERGCQYG